MMILPSSSGKAPQVLLDGNECLPKVTCVFAANDLHDLLTVSVRMLPIGLSDPFAQRGHGTFLLDRQGVAPTVSSSEAIVARHTLSTP